MRRSHLCTAGSSRQAGPETGRVRRALGIEGQPRVALGHHVMRGQPGSSPSRRRRSRPRPRLAPLPLFSLRRTRLIMCELRRDELASAHDLGAPHEIAVGLRACSERAHIKPRWGGVLKDSRWPGAESLGYRMGAGLTDRRWATPPARRVAGCPWRSARSGPPARPADRQRSTAQPLADHATPSLARHRPFSGSCPCRA